MTLTSRLATIGSKQAKIITLLFQLARNLTDEEVANILVALREDNELHELLADARMRGEAHRNNYNNIKAEHTKYV